MNPIGEGADTLIILGRDQATLYEFLKPRQEAATPRTVVILDRRAGERRRDGLGVTPDRRRSDRRGETPEAALALMSVLGFMILHRDGERWTP
ncbi:MAG TPA: hypothetical protein VGX21_07265 [Methylomirabilota bacterium]|jgi:hypothetical protein|nr:hypothetical protein [Methylomirabilota bacterium]